ncbi:arylalcohol dehydrogenase [Dichomitus squalens]|uniref:Arylalcohol dehydrogenase n=1 Tax=Dichomitus squalens TaxID=114155 RepID=A0A4Q9NZX6_9APHY|nr:arylalcohol dehydrogenase [Dichomitus squalens LYAD-421 SS1]EJF63453.1 arylalcohol dehydrogenase [Dichomitus squalens LYAD-421 SS1]TBU46357.1 arylalcohol dehydrogenase [Dichomitus squalens]TBU62268.1 arylalcohol dehydrogenase [Dichomitus squalens]
MAQFQAAVPKTKLGRYRQLAPLAGLHVSPIVLGAMSIGNTSGATVGSAVDKDTSFKFLDAYFDAGGNFIDTANYYLEGSSEEVIGEWMEFRGIRDQVVLATKYTLPFKFKEENITQRVNFIGNNMKSLHVSVESSLKKLRTNYIDILYVHLWDWTCGVEEIVNGLHHLVAAGKVLYLGISDTPAWIVSKANMYARQTGKTPFAVYQGAWSVVYRDIERDIVPMVKAEGMALCPFGVLGAGKIRTDAEEESRRETGVKGWERSEAEKTIAKVLEGVAAEVGANTIQAVAIAYVMQKMPYVFPIIGGRKVEQLHANIQALDIVLTPEHIKRLEDALPFDPGFPIKFIGDGSAYAPFYSMAAQFDKWPAPQPIRLSTN